MESVMVHARFRLVPAAVLLLAGLAAGCGDDSGVGKTYPVEGKVTIESTPLTAESTTILFKPDAARGNSSSFEPVGTVDEAGNYTVETRGKRGAPPGWYKVIVTALAEDPVHPKTAKRRPVAQSLVPARYGQAQTTDLAVEVVEKPAAGAYDLKLKQ
jgi:predicted small secreted protein